MFHRQGKGEEEAAIWQKGRTGRDNILHVWTVMGTGPALSIIGPHYLHKQARWQADGGEMKLRQGDRSACVGLMVDEYTSCLGGGL